jgi:hypothetical protein
VINAIAYDQIGGTITHRVDITRPPAGRNIDDRFTSATNKHRSSLHIRTGRLCSCSSHTTEADGRSGD